MAEKQTVVLAKLKNGTIDETNYADYADKIMLALAGPKGRDGKPTFGGLTTTKIRNLYGYIMNIYTKINEPADFAKHQSDIQYLKVRMAYEAGREESVKNFLDRTGLRGMISNVKTYEQFLLYCRYAESLVAYFKFYGGKDK